jgi:hypothetical protein
VGNQLQLFSMHTFGSNQGEHPLNTGDLHRAPHCLCIEGDQMPWTKTEYLDDQPILKPKKIIFVKFDTR